MKKTILKILIIVSILSLALRFGYQPLFNVLGLNPKTGIKITSNPKATVFIDDKEMGTTPYQDENLKEGEHKIKLTSDLGNWQGFVKLTGGTLSLVNRELAGSTSSSMGEIVTLSRGSGVLITSTPNDAEIEIDGRAVGSSPISISALNSGEHTFLLKHESFAPKSIKAAIPPGMALNINVDLAVLGVISSVVPTPVPKPKLIVLKTPTGFLRIRDQASLTGIEIGKSLPGDNLILLEETSGWFKIRTNSGLEGYVSSQYIQKE